MRSSINFSGILSSLIKERMGYFEPAFHEVSNQFLLYGYKKQLSTSHTGFVLVQASRTQGRYTMEVAVTRGDQYPVHRFYDFPDIGVTGYRESVPAMTKGYNHAEDYPNGDALFRNLYSHLKDAELALSRLAEKTLTKTQRQYDEWNNIYNTWLELERKADGPPGSRYKGVEAETLAFDIIDKTLARGLFDRYLGPLKFKYRNPAFLNCHVYMLARGLEFVEYPDEKSRVEIPNAPPQKKLPDPLDDPITALKGRQPQATSVTLSQVTAERMTQFAFLKSLSAVEALLLLNEQGRPISASGFVPFEGDASGLIEAPVYNDIDPDYDYSQGFPEHAFGPQALPRKAAPPTPSAQPEPEVLTADTKIVVEVKAPKPILPADDDDPIAALENRLGLR